MEKIGMLSQAYRTSKAKSPDMLQFSIGNHSKKSKLDSKISYITQSIPSTRDQSANRNTTPTKLLENYRKKSLHPKESLNDDLNQMKNQIDMIFQALPRIQKKRKIKDETRKNINISFEDSKTGSISKIYNAYSPHRSKSNFSKKKHCFPRISKENSEVSELQKYLFDFHQKSKLLLSELEKKVLGNK